MSRLEYVTECETCDGIGKELDDVSAAALARAIGAPAVANDPCPDCNASGLSRTPLHPDIVERLAMAMFRRANPDEWWKLIASDRRERWMLKAKLIWDEATHEPS